MDQYLLQEYSSKIVEINEWYNLFSSFTPDEISYERREIILQNLLYQFIRAEASYTSKNKRTN
jgi:hypothetical protein